MQTDDSVRKTRDKIDDFGIFMGLDNPQDSLPHYSKREMDALLITDKQDKPKFTLRDLSSKEIDIKEIFKQICPDKFV